MAASGPSLCADGCGFYGSPQTNNLCSKCYKESQKKQEALLPKPIPPAVPSTTAKSDSGPAKADHAGERARCKACNKKVGLLGFTCRCGDVFCGSHRYAEEHGCSVDVKATGRENLAKQNPLCKADKLEFRM